MSLMFRTIALLAMIGVGAGAWLGFQPAEMVKAPVIPERLAVAAAPLALTAPDTAKAILERSPFAPDRAAFNRNAGPSAPPMDVKLTGISTRGKQQRASLMINGQRLVVGQGDTTPAGVVEVIEDSAVVLAGPPERRVEMFKH